MLAHDNLQNHIKTNFILVQQHGWNFADIDEMIPWERTVYLDLLASMLRDEEQQRKDAEMHRRR